MPRSAPRRPLRTLPLLALSGLAACAAAPGPVPELVQRDVRLLLQALYAGDVDTVVAYTHPAVLVTLGGRERVHAAVTDVVRGLQKRGAKLESLTFPRPPEFLQADDRWFAIVPTLAVLVVDGQRFESLNFQFGVLEPDASSWTYIDGSRVEATDVPRLFPGFPSTYRFPAFHRRKL